MAPPAGSAQDPEPIYEEAEVPAYTLPDPLTLSDGTPVESPKTWWNERRPQLLQLFKEHVYGRLPPSPPAFRVEQQSADRTALDGAATRRQVTLHFTDRAEGPTLNLLVYLPNGVDGPAPVFVGLNFAGNHTISADPAVRPPRVKLPRWDGAPSDRDSLIAMTRGSRQKSWPVDSLVARGYGLVTAYHGSLFPDREGGFSESVYQINAPSTDVDSSGGNWGALSAWGWGLHRMVDYAERSEAIDEKRVLAVGHSRLGKATLWAGATDPRFAAVIDNASGAGGSALFRRQYGERVEHLAGSFPHWFCDAFNNYRGNESALPVDQHELLALIAPRPLLVSPKSDDRWTDPKGMFLAAKHASPVWHLLGQEGLTAETMPAPDTPILSQVGFFLRPGGHGLLPADWTVFLDFADRHLSRDPGP